MQNQKVEIVKRIERVCRKTGVDSDNLAELLSTVDLINEQNRIEYEEMLDILENCLFSFADDIRKLKSRHETDTSVNKENRHWIIQSIENYISIYYSRDIYLSQLARLYFMNAQYLCRLFKRETGKSFTDYVNVFRLDIAKQLLVSSQDAIINISAQVGFNNVTYFNRIFKKSMGVTPMEYRQRSNYYPG